MVAAESDMLDMFDLFDSVPVRQPFVKVLAARVNDIIGSSFEEARNRMSRNRISRNRIPQDRMSQEPHVKRTRGYRHGLEQRSLRLPVRQRHQRHPLLAPSGSCFACLGGGGAWVAVLFGLRIHRHSSHGLSVYNRLCFLHQITVPIVSYPHILLPHRLLHAHSRPIVT